MTSAEYLRDCLLNDYPYQIDSIEKVYKAYEKLGFHKIDIAKGIILYKEVIRQTSNDSTYDIQRSIQDLKDMVMYLDENKNSSEIISIQCEVMKQFGSILEQKINMEKSE